MHKNKRLIIGVALLMLLPLICIFAVSCDDMRRPPLEPDASATDVAESTTDNGAEDNSTTEGFVTTDDTTTDGDSTTTDEATTDGGVTTEDNTTTKEDTTTKEEVTTNGDPVPAEKTYVWVIWDALNIRDNPVLASGNILGVAHNGDKFEVLERADTYTKIVYNGGVAYTSANLKYVSFTEPVTKTYVWIVADSLNVRSSYPLSGDNIIGVAYIGDRFEVIEKNSSYTRITYNGGIAYISAQSENVLYTDSNVSENLEVIRKIIYAVETGGQVYGNADYDSFVEAGANTSNEKAITIGAAQWYGTKAKGLLNLIRRTDPTLFAQLDTAGIANDLDTADWSTYAISKTSAKALCIINIINSEVGRACQDKLVDLQMLQYMNEAKALGVTDVAALMMCANIRHQGGNGALKRVIGKTAKPYTLDNIYAALSTDTGNQVGAYTKRQEMVYNSLKKYL